MGKRGNRSGRRLADMSGHTEDEFLSQFPPEELSEDRVDLDVGPEVRCIQVMLNWKYRLVWFAVMLEVFHDGKWQQVARVDTCHDEVHVHQWVQGRRAETGRQILRAVATMEDIEAGFDHACDLLLDNWEENVRRWKHGR